MRVDIQKKLRESKNKNQLKEEMCINVTDKNNQKDVENIVNDNNLKIDNIYKNMI